MEIVIKTILWQIITQCAGTQDMIKKISLMWSMLMKKLIENGCVSFAFKYIIFLYLDEVYHSLKGLQKVGRND